MSVLFGGVMLEREKREGGRRDVLYWGVSPPGEPKGVMRAAGWEGSVMEVP